MPKPYVFPMSDDVRLNIYYELKNDDAFIKQINADAKKVGLALETALTAVGFPFLGTIAAQYNAFIRRVFAPLARYTDSPAEKRRILATFEAHKGGDWENWHTYSPAKLKQTIDKVTNHLNVANNPNDRAAMRYVPVIAHKLAGLVRIGSEVGNASPSVPTATTAESPQNAVKLFALAAAAFAAFS